MLPVDVISFLVTPAVVIVDSSSSHQFHAIKDHVSTPLVCLLSPAAYPRSHRE